VAPIGARAGTDRCQLAMWRLVRWFDLDPNAPWTLTSG
jgi:hypothetical protein